MSEGDKPLVGDVQTQFIFGKAEDYSASVEAARVEQEAMVGYPLVVKSLRQSHMIDEKGRDIYEVFATFAPAPPPPPPAPRDATQV